jgi:hypothetical protein
VEHAEVLELRLVRLLGAWAGPQGEMALEEEALQIKVVLAACDSSSSSSLHAFPSACML